MCLTVSGCVSKKPLVEIKDQELQVLSCENCSHAFTKIRNGTSLGAFGKCCRDYLARISPSPQSPWRLSNVSAAKYVLSLVLGWPKSLLSFFCKIKDIFFISSISLLTWIFWVCQLSPTWCDADCSRWMFQFDHYQHPGVYLTVQHRPARNPRHGTSHTTCDRSGQSQHLLHTLQISLWVSVVFLPFLK